jgi:hypothetical protein
VVGRSIVRLALALANQQEGEGAGGGGGGSGGPLNPAAFGRFLGSMAAGDDHERVQWLYSEYLDLRVCAEDGYAEEARRVLRGWAERADGRG